MSRRWVNIDSIQMVGRLRVANAAKVDAIAKSIAEIGIINPPAVRFVTEMEVDGEMYVNVPVLVIGLHRIEALKRLGRSAVECEVYDVSEDDAVILEADENLARSDLTRSERIRFTAARERAWERKRGKEMGVQNLDTQHSAQDALGRKKSPQQQRKFATETAEATGQSRSAIYKDLEIAKELGDETLDRITGTSLDKGVELDALIKLPEPERSAIIARAADGERVTARAKAAPKPNKMAPAVSALNAMGMMAADYQNSQPQDADQPALDAEEQRFWEFWASLSSDARRRILPQLKALSA